MDSHEHDGKQLSIEERLALWKEQKKKVEKSRRQGVLTDITNISSIPIITARNTNLEAKDKIRSDFLVYNDRLIKTHSSTASEKTTTTISTQTDTSEGIEDEEELYSWEKETIEEVKEALGETLKENEELCVQLGLAERQRERICALESHVRQLDILYEVAMQTIDELNLEASRQKKLQSQNLHTFEKIRKRLEGENKILKTMVNEKENLLKKAECICNSNTEQMKLMRAARQSIERSQALQFSNEVMHQQMKQNDSMYHYFMEQARQHNLSLEVKLQEETRFWKNVLQANIQTLQHQMAEGLARSITKCQRLEELLEEEKAKNLELSDRLRQGETTEQISLSSPNMSEDSSST